MKTFLEEIAAKITQAHPRLDALTIVFPNRRAALYFRKHLGVLMTRPAFAPRLVTIEDFIAGFSPLQVPEKLSLIAILFSAYRQVQLRAEDPDENAIDQLEHFYFWGDMLLRDFDEADKYMVPAGQLFRDLSTQKELDASFDFLTEEQQDFLKAFWGNFNAHPSVNKNRFLQVWRRLGDVYAQFNADLLAKGFGYEGMIHRIVAEKPESLPDHAMPAGPVIFAGFNALTKAEEKIISFFVDRKGAEVYWDMDAYYVNNHVQEAGKFFREYQQHPVLGRTFGAVPSNFQDKVSAGTAVHLYGASQPVGQAKLMAQVLKDQMPLGLKPDETLIVLPDEKLLMTVLHGVSGVADTLNVTMGFPLGSTPMFNFVELLIDLQVTRRDGHFNHRQVLGLLGHPYMVSADPFSASNKRKEILKQNWVHIPKNYLATEVPLHRMIFEEVYGTGHAVSIALIDYLKNITTAVGGLPALNTLDKEYTFHFLKFFNLLESVLREGPAVASPAMPPKSTKPDVPAIKSFLRLFRQLVRLEKIPFTGEPLTGLQVMGVLETRNLDYRNVFILSLNEGAFPATGGKGSYIPHNLRRAYGLPTPEHQDAMYAYLFYRVLQRAENIFLFYNSETDVLGQGEMSRYLQQLVFESGLNLRRHVLHNPILPRPVTPIVIGKSEEVMGQLMKLNEGNAYFRGISPSALNSYIECRLQFYLRHVARIREAKEVEEELDARVLGIFLHDVMEQFYKELALKKNSREVEKSDYEDAAEKIEALIGQVFIKTYKLDPARPVVYEGQRLVVREVVSRFAHRIVEMDKAYAPFTMEALEQADITFPLKIDRAPYQAVLGGKIDRVDRKGDLLRIIDYKTGKDELQFESVASLFSRQGKRNKAAFQTLLYAIMYVNSLPAHLSVSARTHKVVPGLINRMNLFEEGFSFGLKVGQQPVDDAGILFPEFSDRLKLLFEELFDPDQPFDQTTDLNNCKFCPYTQICYRQG